MISKYSIAASGQNLAEYTAMFALDAKELQCKLLECSIGPTSVNAELAAQGNQITTCGPATHDLIKLPFKDFQFELALCSHWLFYLSQEFDLDYHLKAVTELCRVAQELRIYPLTTTAGKTSEYVGPLMQTLQEQGYGLELKATDYASKQGDNAMLRVWSSECKI